MKLDNDYKIIKTLHESSSTIVCRAIRLKDEQKVILKILKQSFRNSHKLSQFVNEEKILSQIKSQHIVVLLETVSTPQVYCHVFEDIGGDSLYNYLQSGSFEFTEALSISKCILQTLSYIHDKQVIHADINPKNIIYNKLTKNIQIIDFGLSIEGGSIINMNETNHSSGNLYYISPEQTGLTEFEVSQVSDVYSCGMSLYHLFSSEMPFDTTDMDELVHKHIAQEPKFLLEIQPSCPPMIEKIISHMIEKNPQKRYQEDKAIVYDLQKCITQLDENDFIKDFTLGTKDKKVLSFSQKLYGRDVELKKLKNLAKNVSLGRESTLIVSGESGVGKTLLVENYFELFDMQKFNIVRTKLDEYDTFISFSGFKQLIMQLSKILMSKDFKKDKEFISQHSREVLSIFLPSLATLFHIKSKNDLQIDLAKELPYAIDELLKKIATKETPLILFLDDLQWIDSMSVELLKKSILQSNNPYLHLLLSYRSEEIEVNKAVYKIVQNLKQLKNNFVLDMKLTLLNVEQVITMMQDLLELSVDEVIKLSRVVHKKTAGNAFYIRALIEYMLERGLLVYSAGKWSFDTGELAVLSSSVNIADVVINRFVHLKNQEKIYLEYLAVLGYSFNLTTTLNMMNTIGFNGIKLRNIFNNGFVELHKNEYSFVHDKIREYIIEDISPKDLRSIHKKIGNYLEKLYNIGVYSDIIIIAQHLNQAYTKEKTPKKLFTFNYLSLEKLLSTNTYKSALFHAKWINKNINIQKLYETTPRKAFRYELLYIHALYGNGHLDEAYEKIQYLIKKVTTTQEKLECFKLFKDISATQGKYFPQAIKFGIKILQDLEVSVPSSKKALNKENNEIQEYISSHKFYTDTKNIIEIKQIKSGRNKLVSSLLVDFWELAYYESNLELMEWCSLVIVHNAFKYGNSVESSFGYVLFGASLAERKEYKKAHAFGEVALKLVKDFGDTAMLPKIYNFVANFIYPYSKSLTKNIPLYQTSLEQSKRNGDMIFGTWANFLMHFSHFLSGSSLDALKTNIELESQFILDSGDTKMIGIFSILKNSLAQLQGTQIGIEVDEEKLVKEWKKDSFYPALAWYGLLKAELLFLNNKLDEALEYLEKYVQTFESRVIMFPKICIHFMRALLLLSKVEKLSSQQEKELELDLQEINSYVKESPKNFKCKKLLLNALLAQKTTTTWKVGELYDKALKEAKAVNNSFYISIVSLATANFWSTLKYKDITKVYLAEAVIGLNSWGAYSVSKKIKENIDRLDTVREKAVLKDDMHSSSRYINSNFHSILQSFYEISQSTDTKSLIMKLMKIILQIAKSSRALLILKEGNSYFIRACIDYATENISLTDRDLAEYEDVPREAIFYAVNTQENLKVVNPAHSGAFQYDSYIKRKNPASIIVIPIKIDGLISGVLYLEDEKLDVGVSDESIGVLHLLLTQAAIIFQNTQFIEQLRINERNLNQAQLISHTGSWQFNSLTLKIVWTAQTYRIFDLEPFSVEIDNDLFFSFVHPDDREKVSQAVDMTISQNGKYSIDHRIVTARGVEKFVHQEAELIVENGIKKMFGTIQDVTEHVMKDRMLIIQSRQAQMGEMISMIAHQWRQPLTVISTIISTQTLYLALDKFEVEKLPKAFDDVNAQIQYLSKTIDDFRNFFKPNKKIKFINFEKLVDSSIQLIKHSLESKSIVTKVVIKKNLEFESFENELQQVILNIFSNAQDAYEGKDISNKMISVTVDADDTFSYLYIEDKAGGIDKEVLSTLFLPYISTKLGKNGTGLGLYMSKTIVENHCFGSIEAHNVKSGAQFVIKIPLKHP